MFIILVKLDIFKHLKFKFHFGFFNCINNNIATFNFLLIKSKINIYIFLKYVKCQFSQIFYKWAKISKCGLRQKFRSGHVKLDFLYLVSNVSNFKSLQTVVWFRPVSLFQILFISNNKCDFVAIFLNKILNNIIE